jgi:demethylmenaquinone methyltransferase/2-methoxy-6-polyprenyl-1,4-benzoquinol methylase
MRRMSTVTPGGAPDKRAAVQGMFGRIAGRYDLMNTLMTGGLDRLWRSITARAAQLPAGGLALDVGTGTGDLALDLARSVPGGRVIGLDYTGQMLARAPGKASAQGLAEHTGWVRGDGQALPFADGAFDAVTSAFVLRNFADIGQAYAEMARVVRPGGRVVALEISPASRPLWREAFRLYFHSLVPLVGRLVTGDPVAYSYLPASVDAFLSPDQVQDVMRRAGLEPLPARRLMLGSLVVHQGQKPRRAA